MRACPYCNSSDVRIFGERLGATYLRCLGCRSIHMDLAAADYARLHEQAFSDKAFLSDAVSAHSTEPDRRLWNEFAHLFPPGPLLEIGPGAGHFLAAAAEAKREVFAVEASAVHREFIASTWGFRDVFGSLEELPATTPRFAAVAMFNTIEHVFDVARLFESIRSRLGPNGVVFVTTCNAECVIVPVVRTYWSMFKQPDHVSLPSGDGFRRLGDRTKLPCRRTWTGELPLETPIGMAVAVRDWVRERRGAEQGNSPRSAQDAPRVESPTTEQVPFQRRMARRLMKASARIDPHPAPDRARRKSREPPRIVRPRRSLAPPENALPPPFWLASFERFAPRNISSVLRNAHGGS